MVRLHVVVEGQTEETFVRDILAPVVGEASVFADVHRVTTGRRRSKSYRGGFLRYAHLRRDLELWMSEDRGVDSWFTTMVDLYRLPQDVPGYSGSRSIADPVKRVRFLEDALKADLGHRQFIPYIQLHEFEALLFSGPASFAAAFPDEYGAVAELGRIRRSAASPEHIDDGIGTSPAERIRGLLPQYTKAVHGPIIAGRIGLARMRKECAHFNEWIDLILGLDEATKQSKRDHF